VLVSCPGLLELEGSLVQGSVEIEILSWYLLEVGETNPRHRQSPVPKSVPSPPENLEARSLQIRRLRSSVTRADLFSRITSFWGVVLHRELTKILYSGEFSCT
jgi:hypothetical protein